MKLTPLAIPVKLTVKIFCKKLEFVGFDLKSSDE